LGGTVSLGVGIAAAVLFAAAEALVVAAFAALVDAESVLTAVDADPDALADGTAVADALLLAGAAVLTDNAALVLLAALVVADTTAPAAPPQADRDNAATPPAIAVRRRRRGIRAFVVSMPSSSGDRERLINRHATPYLSDGASEEFYKATAGSSRTFTVR